MELTFVFVCQGKEPSIQPIRVQEAVQRNKRSRHMCENCDKVIIGDLEWTGTPGFPCFHINPFLFILFIYSS